MNVRLTRDSVAAADDMDAPHEKCFAVDEALTIEGLLQKICALGYLPLVAGGRATWSFTSHRPLAVVAQQWTAPKLLPMIQGGVGQLAQRDGRIRVHVNYHAQVDPEVTYDVLCRCRPCCD